MGRRRSGDGASPVDRGHERKSMRGIRISDICGEESE